MPDLDPLPWPVSDAVRRLVEAASPSRVLLFGSWATGRATPASDVDLIVVTSPEGAWCATAGQLRQLFWDAPYRVDLIVRSEGELREQAGDGESFVATVLPRVREVYRRPAHRPQTAKTPEQLG